MLSFTYPDVSTIELVAIQPKPADTRSIEHLQTTENISIDPISYLVKINLSSKLPITAAGFQLYVGDYWIQKYSGFKHGLYFKVNDPRFFAEYAGREIRFALNNGETVHNTGVTLPTLASDGRRGSMTSADLQALPTQEDVLNAN